jgi:hypothetical protein
MLCRGVWGCARKISVTHSLHCGERKPVLGLHAACAWGGGASWLSNRNSLPGVLWPTPIELEFDAEPGHRYCIEVDVRAQSYTAQIEFCDK